ncbi:SRPBCC family protein [Azotobacter salinestris]|uniref:SRPBCC family protein n=1 Tax=Azotobacter salinestris TaxID=69964 RepID=UPI0032E00EA8
MVEYFPLQKVRSDWKEGGEILLEGESEGRKFTDHGVIQVLSHPSRFRYGYWSDNHGTARTPENHLTIDYRLSPERQGTRLDLAQDNLRSDELFGIMDRVWDALLGSLKEYVEQRVPSPRTPREPSA